MIEKKSVGTDNRSAIPDEEDSPKLVIPLNWIGRVLSRLSKLNLLGTFFIFRQKITRKDGTLKETEIKIGPNVKDGGSAE